MEELFVTVTDIFGIKTVLSSIVVCLVLHLIKKKKPNLSEKERLVIRIIVSTIIGIIYLLITKGDFSCTLTTAIEICGVSMILCGLFSNGDTVENKRLLSKFLPNLSSKQLDELLSLESKDQIETALIDKTNGVSKEQFEVISLIISNTFNEKPRV
jgi:hypothetical protein